MNTLFGESTTGAVHRKELSVEPFGLPSDALHRKDTSSEDTLWATKLKTLPEETSFSIVAAAAAIFKNAKIKAALAKTANVFSWGRHHGAKCLDELEHLLSNLTLPS